jgi:hypothetical protein
MNDIVRVGNSEYDATYSIIPTLMTIYRGYSWLDLKHNGTTVRAITTHLESIWDQDKKPNSVLQAEQLIDDLKSSSMPLVVMGDFNADFRDPRGSNEPNPGEQPVIGKSCPTPADRRCNAYWLMFDAGFQNVSPDAKDPKNFSWGATALLNGPDPKRVAASKNMGSEFGFTDRLDYIFIKNFNSSAQSEMIGNTYPEGPSIWQCGTEKCFATDHAGVVATFKVPGGNSAVDAPLPTHSRFPLGIWHVIGIALIALLFWRFAHSRKGR